MKKESRVRTDRLIEARILKGYKSLPKFAEMIGMPYTTIKNYETGDREPGSDYLTKLSTICDVSIDWLLGISDMRQKSTTIFPMEIQKLQDALNNLNPEGRAELINYADYLLTQSKYKKHSLSDGLQEEA